MMVKDRLEGGNDRGVLKILSHGESVGPAVSRDNWDTVYYRLRAILAVCSVWLDRRRWVARDSWP